MLALPSHASVSLEVTSSVRRLTHGQTPFAGCKWSSDVGRPTDETSLRVIQRETDTRTATDSAQRKTQSSRQLLCPMCDDGLALPLLAGTRYNLPASRHASS